MDTQGILQHIKDNAAAIVKDAMLNEFDDERKMIAKELEGKMEEMIKDAKDQIIKQLAKSGKIPVVHRIEFNDEALIRSKTKGHNCLRKVVQMAKAGINILLEGPYGCGKNTIARHVAKLLKKNFTLNLKSRVNESLVTCIQNIHLFDASEVRNLRDLIDQNSNGMVPEDERLIIIATTDPGDLVDPSLKEIFRIGKIEIGFDEEIESQICPDAELLQWMWLIRKNAKKFGTHNVRNCHFSTRTIKEAYILKSAANWPMEEIKPHLLKGLTEIDIERLESGSYS